MAKVILTEREHALADLITQKVLAAIQAETQPKVTGLEAAKILGISYSKFTVLHLDSGNIFRIPNTKRYWRRDVECLRNKLEAF